MADVTITSVATPLAGALNAFAWGTAGSAIALGDFVYRDSADSYKLKPADTTSAAKAAVAGIALNAAASGEPVRIQTAGRITLGASLSVGMVYVLSGTSGAGNMCPVTDLDNTEYLTLLGACSASATLDLKLWASGIYSQTSI